MKKTPKITCKLGKDDTLFPKKPSQQIRIIQESKEVEASKRRRNSELTTQELYKERSVRCEELFDVDFSRINTIQSDDDHDLSTLAGVFKTIDRPTKTRLSSPRRTYQKKRSEGRVVPHVFVRLA